MKGLLIGLLIAAIILVGGVIAIQEGVINTTLTTNLTNEITEKWAQVKAWGIWQDIKNAWNELKGSTSTT